jgi:hypothetical protein
VDNIGLLTDLDPKAKARAEALAAAGAAAPGGETK